MANDFEILLQTRLNTQNAQKMYESWRSSIQKKPINLDMTINSNSLKTLKTELGSVQTQIDNFSNTTAANFNKMTKAVEVVTTQTDKYKIANEGLRTVITKTNEAGQQFRTIVDKVVDGQGKLVTTTQNLTQVQNGNLKYWTQFGNKITEITADYAKAENEENKLRQSLVETNNQLNQTQSAGNNAASGLNNAAHASQTLAQRITTAAGKVALFKVSTTIVMAFYNAITQAKDAVVAFDKAMVEFNKVTPLSNNEIEKMLSNFEKLSSEVGRTKTELVEIATEMSKSGFGTSTEEVTRMAELTALYQNTADEELSAADASKVLISQMRAFNYTADDAIHILDSINKVSAEFAVSSGDIGRGLTQAGAALQTYGNDYDQTVGLLTGASEIFINRSQQVARGSISPKYTEMCIICTTLKSVIPKAS